MLDHPFAVLYILEINSMYIVQCRICLSLNEISNHAPYIQVMILLFCIQVINGQFLNLLVT